MLVKRFTTHTYKENTYVLYDETKECVIIDCGSETITERFTLIDFIETHRLRPVRLLCTHYHLDHVMGNAFITSRFGIKPEANKGEKRLARIINYQAIALGFNGKVDEQSMPLLTLDDDSTIQFGVSKLKVIHTPGHTPGGVAFYSPSEGILISGDTVMKHSFGATNLPGGKEDELKASVAKLLSLPDDVVIFPGHGDMTTVWDEKVFNKLVKDEALCV